MTCEQIAEHHRRQQVVDGRLNASRLAYTGWLAINAVFRQEVHLLRKKWHNEIQALGRFPQVEASFFGQSQWQIASANHELNNDFLMLYKNWCLESLATWDLPIPLQAHLLDKTLYSFRVAAEYDDKLAVNQSPRHLRLEKIDSLGFLGFIPWYIFRDKRVDLQELASLRLKSGSLRHLDGWIERRPKNWGAKRSMKLLKLFVYLELGLRIRYPAKIKSAAQRLDEVFTHYFSGKGYADTDNVKKMRLEMQRRLAAGT
jgi:hypothetical protein